MFYFTFTINCYQSNGKMYNSSRFPLIDGTLFVSPTLYDPKKAVQALISNKKQYIYGMCLKCLSATDPDHKIECKFCHTPWLNGRTLQIGSQNTFVCKKGNFVFKVRVSFLMKELCTNMTYSQLFRAVPCELPANTARNR